MLRLHWNECTTILEINPDVVFSEVVQHYFREQGIASGDVLYEGSSLNLDMTARQLNLESGADLYVYNVTIVDVSNNRTLEIKVYNNTPNGYRLIGNRWYSISSDSLIKCEDLVFVIKSDLGLRPIHIVNGSIVMNMQDYINTDKSIVAIID